RQPREVLGAIPGMDLVEMREATWCCGSAGVQNTTPRGRADKMLGRKLTNIAASGADTVAVGNPGCLLQLMAGVRERGMDVDVVHPVDLPARAFGKEARLQVG